MRAVIDDDLGVFAAAALPWLEREPVLNNVFCSLIAERLNGVTPVEEGALWVRILDGADVAGVALRTPPYELLVSALSPGAATALVDALASRELPGVRGVLAGTAAFVPAWCARTGGHAERTMAQRMYRIDAVTSPQDVPGRLRLATVDDASLAASWARGFESDVGGPPHAGATLTGLVPRWIELQNLWLWDVDGAAVSMAAVRPSAVRLPRVSLVYTPQEHRRHGYAGASVAALSQHLLDAGAQACMLFTDLANPTSNGVYQRIGYRPVADADVWRFSESVRQAPDPATPDPRPGPSEAGPA